MHQSPNPSYLSRPSTSLTLIAAILLASMPTSAVIVDDATPQLRLRAGSDNNRVNTVIYNAGMPGDLDGFAGATAEPETISTNVISGGNATYTVRVVTDVNARTGNINIRTVLPLTGVFSYDSSTPLSCITPASCGGETIPFSKIKWVTEDSDTLNSVTQYDDSANQVFQTQTDNDDRQRREDTRHRNHYQYIYINDLLRPAGTYEGTVTITGVTNQ